MVKNTVTREFGVTALICAKAPAAVYLSLFLSRQYKFNTVKKAYVLVLLLKLFWPLKGSEELRESFGVSQESVKYILRTSRCSVQSKTVSTPKKINSTFTSSYNMWPILNPISENHLLGFFFHFFCWTQLNSHIEFGWYVFDQPKTVPWPWILEESRLSVI